MNRRRIPEGFPWVLPSLVVLLALSIYPLIYSVKLAAADRRNFTRLFTDRLFLTASIQTIWLTLSALSIEFLLGLALALLIDSLARGRMFFRTALLIPMLLPPVVVGFGAWVLRGGRWVFWCLVGVVWGGLGGGAFFFFLPLRGGLGGVPP